MVLLLRQRTCQAGVTRSRTLYLATRNTQVFLFRRSWLRFPSRLISHHRPGVRSGGRLTGYKTIETVSCALAWSRYSYVDGLFVSFGLCTVSEVLRQRSRVAFSNVRTNPVLVRCVLRRCSTLSSRNQVLPVGGMTLSDLPSL